MASSRRTSMTAACGSTGAEEVREQSIRSPFPLDLLLLRVPQLPPCSGDVHAMADHGAAATPCAPRALHMASEASSDADGDLRTGPRAAAEHFEAAQRRAAERRDAARFGSAAELDRRIGERLDEAALGSAGGHRRRGVEQDAGGVGADQDARVETQAPPRREVVLHAAAGDDQERRAVVVADLHLVAFPEADLAEQHERI